MSSNTLTPSFCVFLRQICCSVYISSKIMQPEFRKCVCVCVKSLQKPDRVDMEMVKEVCIGRSSIGALVLHQVALQGLLAGVALLHHPQLRQRETQDAQFYQWQQVAASSFKHWDSFILIWLWCFQQFTQYGKTTATFTAHEATCGASNQRLAKTEKVSCWWSLGANIDAQLLTVITLHLFQEFLHHLQDIYYLKMSWQLKWCLEVKVCLFICTIPNRK